MLLWLFGWLNTFLWCFMEFILFRMECNICCWFECCCQWRFRLCSIFRFHRLNKCSHYDSFNDFFAFMGDLSIYNSFSWEFNILTILCSLEFICFWILLGKMCNTIRYISVNYRFHFCDDSIMSFDRLCNLARSELRNNLKIFNRNDPYSTFIFSC